MIIQRLSHVSLSSKRLDKVQKFYVGILGFKVVHEFINPKTNELYGYFLSSGKNTFLEFFTVKKKINKKNSVFRHLCFEVSDIYNFKKKLKNKSSKIKRGKTDKILQFFTKDLEGNIIEFHQRDKYSKF